MTQYLEQNDQILQNTSNADLNHDLHKKNIITFSDGLIGLSNYKQFYIEDLKNDINPNFKSMQSTQQNNIAFVILPITISNIYDQDDIQELANILNTSQDNLICYAIVNLEIEHGKFNQFLNLKAPIAINKENFNAVQHIFKNNKYAIKHKYL